MVEIKKLMTYFNTKKDCCQKFDFRFRSAL
jgi:hypothetical protein